MGELGFASFDAQTRAFRLARAILASRLSGDGRAPTGPAATGPEEPGPHDEERRDDAGVIAREVLPAVDRIERGLGLTERAQRLDPATARALLRRAGVVGPALGRAEREAADRERALLARRRTPSLDLSAGQVLAAARHAQLVFAMIPRLPPELVTWPRARIGSGYADVPPPAGIGDLVWRVEELEAVLWRAATRRTIEADEHLRRTYAFCETACWLDVGLAPH